MAEIMTTGVWVVDQSKQAAFIEEWAALAAWASSTGGARTLRIGRDRSNPDRFVSFAVWDSADRARAWKASLDYPEHMANVLQYVDEFLPTELDIVHNLDEVAWVTS